MLLERFLTKQVDRLPVPLAGSISDQATLRQLADLHTVVLTSISLLYDGPPRLNQYFAVLNQTLETKQETLQIAAGLAAGSRLPIYASFLQAAKENGLAIREIETDRIADNGVLGKLDRTWYVLGDESVMKAENIELGATSRALMQQLELAGKKMYFLAQKQPKRLLGIFAAEPHLQEDAAEAVQALFDLGIEIILLTEEKTRVARGITKQLGIRLVNSELREGEKGQLILSLQEATPATGFILSKDTVHYAGRVQLPIVLARKLNIKTAVRLNSFSELPLLVSYARESMTRARKRFFWCKI